MLEEWGGSSAGAALIARREMRARGPGNRHAGREGNPIHHETPSAPVERP